jgi:hypothetical protein
MGLKGLSIDARVSQRRISGCHFARLLSTATVVIVDG